VISTILGSQRRRVFAAETMRYIRGLLGGSNRLMDVKRAINFNYKHTYIYTYIYTYIHIYIYTYIHIYIYIHTYIYILIVLSIIPKHGCSDFPRRLAGTAGRFFTANAAQERSRHLKPRDTWVDHWKWAMARSTPNTCVCVRVCI
jgi:hypothetical protein